MKTKNAPVKVKAVKKEAVNTENKEASFKSKNIVILTGNLGKDPVVQTFENGRKKAFFTMATNRTIQKKEGESDRETLWHSLVAWGKLAEKVETSLKMGDRISVTGRINTRNYTDRTGANRIFTEIIMRSMDIIETKQPVPVNQ